MITDDTTIPFRFSDTKVQQIDTHVYPCPNFLTYINFQESETSMEVPEFRP